jgi:hypothetical protein
MRGMAKQIPDEFTLVPARPSGLSASARHKLQTNCKQVANALPFEMIPPLTHCRNCNMFQGLKL